MSKKRAFVRYSKQGKIVPGSLILTGGSHPNGPSTWKEVSADLCCDGGCESIGPFTFTQSEEPGTYGSGSYISLEFNCLTEGNIQFTGTSGYAIAPLSGFVNNPTTSQVVDLINTAFAGQGITAQVVEGLLQVTVSNTDYISTSCPGSLLVLGVLLKQF